VITENKKMVFILLTVVVKRLRLMSPM